MLIALFDCCKVNSFYKITTENQTIIVTEEHPFYVVDKGWVKVKNLLTKDLLKTSTLKKERILKIEKDNAIQEVYNIEVDGNHNCFITRSTILVHNKNIKKQIILYGNHTS